jgi:hypothetical protein
MEVLRRDCRTTGQEVHAVHSEHEMTASKGSAMTPAVVFAILPLRQRRLKMHRIARATLHSGRSEKPVSAYPYKLGRL